MILRPSIWTNTTRQPPTGADLKINTSHPANYGLGGWYVLNEGRGKATLTDLVANQNASLTNANPSTCWTPSPMGLGVTFASASSEYATATIPAQSRPVTFCFTFQMTTAGNWYSIVGMPDTTDNGGNSGWRVGVDNSNNLSLTFGGVAGYTFTVLSTLSAGVIYRAVVTVPSSGTATAYIKPLVAGTLQIGVTSTLGTPRGTPNRLMLSNRGDNSDFFNGSLYDVAWYSRVLSEAEAIEYIRGPYGSPLNPRFLLVPMVEGVAAAAASGDMVCTMSATGTLSPTLTGAGALTASPAATGSLSATLLGAGSMAASPAATGSLSANLGGTGVMTSTVTGTGSLSGTLLGDGALASTLAATGTLTPALTGDGALAASLSGTGTLTGTASAPGDISSALSGTGALSGTLLGAGAMSCTMAATGSLSATLLGAGALTASLASTGTLTAALAGAGALSSTLAATGSLSGTLLGAGAMAATLAATGTFTIETSGLSQIAATLTASGSLSGTLLGAGAMTAALSATGALSPSLTGSGALTAALAATGALSPGLTGDVAISATMTATSSFTSSLLGSGALATSLAATGSLSALIQASGAMAASMGGTGSFSVSLADPNDPVPFVLAFASAVAHRLTTLSKSPLVIEDVK